MLNRRILARTRTILSRAVGALGGDKMLNAEFMPHKMHRHPIWKVCPLPRKDELADWRMFREKNRLLPLGGRFLCALRHADCSAGGIRDATPRADYLEKFQCCTVHAVDYTICGSFCHSGLTKRQKEMKGFKISALFASLKKYLQHNCGRFDFLIKFSPLNFGTDATVDATS